MKIELFWKIAYFEHQLTIKIMNCTGCLLEVLLCFPPELFLLHIYEKFLHENQIRLIDEATELYLEFSILLVCFYPPILERRSFKDFVLSAAGNGLMSKALSKHNGQLVFAYRRMMYSIVKYRGWYDAANLDRNGTGSMLLAGVHVDDMDVLKARDVADVS
ncbi:hypothetical protein L1987_46866 [Smallanthus sonchifolius]|uniref:Uncharacterized protein n=1 Tax=Smallanthus sonchifolius TaxID=185202 RepID=A0ACB9G2Q5_9ASTR|nr:hypothetical protein L1987_46866 [Smallanthus sonchifolius]